MGDSTIIDRRLNGKNRSLPNRERFIRRYKTQLKKVADTQAVIDSVVGYITSVNYKDFPDVVNMMDDAVDQLGKIKDAKAKADEAAGKKDWNNAALWTEQIWQYQVKAADLGLRAKTYLEQNGAKKVK